MQVMIPSKLAGSNFGHKAASPPLAEGGLRFAGNCSTHALVGWDELGEVGWNTSLRNLLLHILQAVFIFVRPFKYTHMV